MAASQTSLDTVAFLDAQIASLNEEIESLRRKRSELEQQRSSILSSLQSLPPAPKSAASQAVDYDREDFAWSRGAGETAKKIWGIDEFRHNQRAIINAVLSGRDVFVVMPTGGGKSLCFQLPAVLRSGLTVVISPLISLIRDQVLGLEEVGVSAKMLHSGTSKDETKSILDGVGGSDCSWDARIIYVTPERIAKSKRFMTALEKRYGMGKLDLLVIDEAHCCSQYGHDFRPDYKKLGILKTMFPQTPLIALSATCPLSLMDSVLSILNMKPIDPVTGTLLFSSPLHRKNLSYSILPKAVSFKDQLAQMAEYILVNHKDSCGIVYCLSKKDTEQVAEGLRGASGGSLKVGVYHADLDDRNRDRIHFEWKRGAIKVVVATIAFGMGINQKNVRFVIHHTMSKSVEGYYQESGRAGRDGMPADCILYYRGQDGPRLSSMVLLEYDGLKGVHAMLKYCEDTSTCRKLLMDRYFNLSQDALGASLPSPLTHRSKAERLDECGTCDHCSMKQRGFQVVRTDVSSEVAAVLMILTALQGSDEKATFLRLLELWRGVGKTSPAVAALARDGQPGFPPPKTLSKDDQERIIIQMLLQGLIKEDFHFTPYSTIVYFRISERGKLHIMSASQGLPHGVFEIETLVDPRAPVSGKDAGAKRRRSTKSVLEDSASIVAVPVDMVAECAGTQPRSKKARTRLSGRDGLTVSTTSSPECITIISDEDP
ncbi:P-loop containing nucleoside triphosphate hydrolase protein [Polychytrium aggregatum]|uniref:P-loop containing nucleoside triphosphate hydrolase protein n=1 Tax=Polychytrium aggregatum TaxID=110093 RepID=UPI0022FE9563|nr:P-loop containing nucleoside triphosphate hydrolase protein [Polychytrium aggregatum]KAI9206909.1 P-loop containing nucleoside triphosphate hydrolase protein [Polychytrium aggregatum]